MDPAQTLAGQSVSPRFVRSVPRQLASSARMARSHAPRLHHGHGPCWMPFTIVVSAGFTENPQKQPETDAYPFQGRESQSHRALRLSIHHLTLMVTDLYGRDGRDPTTLPGWNDLPPSRSPSPSANSPSVQSSSSTGAAMAALTITDDQSAGSAHSSAPSDRRPKPKPGK